MTTCDNWWFFTATNVRNNQDVHATARSQSISYFCFLIAIVYRVCAWFIIYGWFSSILLGDTWGLSSNWARCDSGQVEIHCGKKPRADPDSRGASSAYDYSRVKRRIERVRESTERKRKTSVTCLQTYKLCPLSPPPSTFSHLRPSIRPSIPAVSLWSWPLSLLSLLIISCCCRDLREGGGLVN